MLAILSDIHGNLAALEAVISHSIARGCDRFISLGDVMGYGPKPGECIELLRSLNAINILGNHDSYITLNENCSRSRVVSQIINYQREIINKEHIEWLKKSLPFLRENGLYFVHGGPNDPRDQYIYEVSPSIIPDDVMWLFSGHTHVQILADFGRCGYCNPGSVGQPRDGDCRAAYATMEKGIISLHRVDYDIEKTVSEMKAAGFESFCYENLYKGAQIGGRIDKVKIVY